MAEAVVVRVEVALLTLTGQPSGLHLLLSEPDPPSGPHLPGGPLPRDLGLQAAAMDVLAAAGVGEPRHLEQLATFGEPDVTDADRTVSVTYLALVTAPSPGVRGRWVPCADLPPLAADQARIATTAVQRVRSKLSYSTIAYGLLGEEFTMSELQEVYEAVLATTLDKRNFRKKVHALDLVEETGRLRRGQHRPAQLYRFRSSRLVLLDDVIATA